MGTQYIDVVLFALVAVFLGLRLRSVLGRRTGNEKPPPEQSYRQDWRGGMGQSQPRPPGSGQVIDVRPVANRTTNQPGANQPPGIAAIMEADPSFSPEGFMAGARGAFEMILHAFAEGDEATLRGLLETQVFESFSGAIRARNEAGEICANTLDGIEHAEIAEAGLASTAQARITVRFASKQRHATRDHEGKVIDGDPDHVLELVDLWTFTRDLRSRDPNWHLAATSTPEE